MRGRVVAVCAAVVLAFPLVGGAAGQARGQDTRPGIAVFPFVNSGSFGQDKENFEALERGLAAMLISELSTNPQARLVDREQVQRLIEEQNLGTSGRVDAQTAARIGKLAGAQYVITGPLTDFYAPFLMEPHLVNS